MTIFDSALDANITLKSPVSVVSIFFTSLYPSTSSKPKNLSFLLSYFIFISSAAISFILSIVKFATVLSPILIFSLSGSISNTTFEVSLPPNFNLPM